MPALLSRRPLLLVRRPPLRVGQSFLLLDLLRGSLIYLRQSLLLAHKLVRLEVGRLCLRLLRLQVLRR
jgi:hypothetical protein